MANNPKSGISINIRGGKYLCCRGDSNTSIRFSKVDPFGRISHATKVYSTIGASQISKNH